MCAQAVLIREEISHMTCGMLTDFLIAARELLTEARNTANEIIHAIALFPRVSETGRGYEVRTGQSAPV